MPFKVAMMVEVDSSATSSSFDPDETVLETSMMLLSPPTTQRPFSPDLSNIVAKETVNTNNLNCDSGERQKDYDDPDETIFEGVEEAKCGLQRSILSTPLKHSNMSQNRPDNVGQKMNSNLIVIGNKHKRVMEQESQSEESHQSYQFDTEDKYPIMKLLKGRHDDDDNNYQRYYNNMKSIIAKNRDLVQLPAFDSNDDVDKRISILHLYIKESGIQFVLDKLGINARDYCQPDGLSSREKSSPNIRMDTDDFISEVANLAASTGVDSSVEIGRYNNDQNRQHFSHSISFQSPIFHENDQEYKLSKKRQASTSGKKGADYHRKRLDDESLIHPIHEELPGIECHIVGSHLVQSFGSNDGCSDSITSPLQSEKNHSSFLDSALFSPISQQESLPLCQDESYTTSSSLHTHMSPTCKVGSKIVEKQIKHNYGQKDCEAHSEHSSSDEDSLRSNINETIPSSFKSSVNKSSLVNSGTNNDIQRKTKSSHFDKNTSHIFCASHDSTSKVHSQDDHAEYSEESDDASSFVHYPKDSDSIESVNSIELCHRGQKGQVQHHNSHEDDKRLQHAVTLKGNSCIHYNPLKVYRPPKWAKLYENKRKQEMKKSFNELAKGDNDDLASHDRRLRDTTARPLPTLTMIQNPFKEFGSRESDRLHVVLDWLRNRDCGASSEEESTLSGKAVILSLNQRQIICLILQLILSDCGCYNDAVRYKNNTFLDYSGGTLIVVKEKDDICEWECELREKTGFTVFNHVALSSSERRSANITSKASTFDIVLTTYDALKNKEATVCVDINGRVTKQADNYGGWLASRTNQTSDEDKLRSAVLSRLHLLNWQRVVFIDDLGGKSYLTKPGTSRAEVACSVKGKSRIICFVKSSGPNFFFEDKVKESRRQLIPLAKMFDVPANRTASDLVGKIMLDYRDVMEHENDNEEEEVSECTSRFSYCSIGLSE